MFRRVEADKFYQDLSPVWKHIYKGAYSVVLLLCVGIAICFVGILDDIYHPAGDRWQDSFSSPEKRAELRRIDQARIENLRFLERFGTLRAALCPDTKIWASMLPEEKERYYVLQASFGWNASSGYGKKINEHGCVTTRAHM